jgi:hypothetical protein
MAQIDWQSIMNGHQQQKSRWAGANVKFMMVCRKNETKSAEAGREIYDEIPSISIQWPGGDETVRAIEERDKVEHPQAYAAFMAGTGPVQSGMPLQEWPRVTASAIKELAYLGFRTVEQLAEANDEVKRRMGPLSKFVKEAQEWIAAATSGQSQVVALKEALDRERTRAERMEQQIELLMQRIEGNEGTRFTRPAPTWQNEVTEAVDAAESLDDVEVQLEKRGRGRPRKI